MADLLPTGGSGRLSYASRGSELPVPGAAFAYDRREVKNKTKGTYAAALALVAVLAGGVIPAAATEAPPPSAVATNTDVSP